MLLKYRMNYMLIQHPNPLPIGDLTSLYSKVEIISDLIILDDIKIRLIIIEKINYFIGIIWICDN